MSQLQKVIVKCLQEFTCFREELASPKWKQCHRFGASFLLRFLSNLVVKLTVPLASFV
jgi:hypothetical protein